MINLVTHFAEASGSSSGISALGLNLTSFLIQLGTFIIAYLILRKWAFKPISQMLQERRETIEQGVSLGEKMKKDEAKAESKIEEELAKARAEADKIIADAHSRGRQTIADAEDKAKQKAEATLASAKDRIEQEQRAARKKLESEVANLVAEATEAVVREKVDTKKDAQLIDQALKGQK